MLLKTTLVVGAAAITAALTLTLTAPASTPRLRETYQGRTAMQWHQLALKRRVALQSARTRLGSAMRYSRRLQRELARSVARSKPDVSYAIRLAATAYGVSERDMHVVASCESGHSPTARNGQYRGVYQEGPMFERGRFGQAGFSVWDPVANAMTAAETVSREGWSQWSCKP